VAEPSTALPAVPADLQTATLCVDAGPYRQAPAAVPTQLVERLEHELATSPPAARPCHGFGRPIVTVLGVSAWGDHIVYPIAPCGQLSLGYTAGWPRDSAASYILSDDLLADLDALPRGAPVRVRTATRKTSPPATPG
jgi:hypothetical protein